MMNVLVWVKSFVSANIADKTRKKTETKQDDKIKKRKDKNLVILMEPESGLADRKYIAPWCCK
jgi:hypothetical protein